MISFRSKLLCIILIVISFGVLVGTTFDMSHSTQFDINVGSVCPQDIYATRDIVDTTTTEARRNAASESVKDVYVVDLETTNNTVARAKNILSELFNSREKAVLISLTVFPDVVPDIENTTGLPNEIFETALSLTDEQFNTLSKVTPELLEHLMTEGVSNTVDALNEFDMLLSTHHLPSSSENIAFEIASEVITLNKSVDVEETENQRRIKRESVKDVVYLKNQVIARKGDIITQAQYTMLTQLGFISGESSVDYSRIVSTILILLITLLLSVLYYLKIERGKISATMVATTFICSLLVCIGAVVMFFTFDKENNLFFIMALSIIPALISLLLSGSLAGVVNIIIASLVAIHTEDYILSFAVIISGIATGFYFSKVRRRAHLLPATVVSAFTYALIYTTLSLNGAKDLIDVFKNFGISFLGCFFGGILAIGTIPFWEAIFDVITPMKLGELSNPEHKLLKTMLLKAPGTYHHSLTVANMAEAAANAIGANPLLARVGAYYHDIGKTEQAHYFKENQLGDNNPHDLLPPEESADILLKHVSDGVHLAEQYRLPSAVKDIIAQHHGTTTTSYFLYKAKEKNADVDTSLFTYPGPKPKTKEATIIMLADACEAAVRAVRESGKGDAGEVIDKIISSRISEGQLSNSSLTFSDLKCVKESFVTTLEQYFHKRILYPENKEQK